MTDVPAPRSSVPSGAPTVLIDRPASACTAPNLVLTHCNLSAGWKVFLENPSTRQQLRLIIPEIAQSFASAAGLRATVLSSSSTLVS